MTIKIPRNYMGEPIEGSMERILAGSPLSPIPLTQPFVPTPVNINNPHDYIILPGATHGNYSYPEMLVSMERTHNGKNWNDAYAALINEGASMLSIRQFADFLSLLKSGNAFDGNALSIDKVKLDSILDEIYTVRSPWRSEWLDAKFTVTDKTFGIFGGKTFINYDHKLINGQLVAQRNEELEECLMGDKQIDISDWLVNATSQGLPSKNVNDGNLYYWKPKNGTVAWFWAGSDWAGLICDGDPSGSRESLGVRLARAKI